MKFYSFPLTSIQFTKNKTSFVSTKDVLVVVKIDKMKIGLWKMETPFMKTSLVKQN
jgi:hypothetical protein